MESIGNHNVLSPERLRSSNREKPDTINDGPGRNWWWTTHLRVTIRSFIASNRLLNDPDAYMIEVADTAIGFAGYVTSLPIKLNDKPAENRDANEAGWMGPRESGN